MYTYEKIELTAKMGENNSCLNSLKKHTSMDTSVTEHKNENKDIHKSLIEACKKGNIGKVRSFLQRGANPNFKDKSTGCNSLAVVLQTKSVKTKDKEAAKFFEIAKELLKHGANPYLTNLEGSTSLYFLISQTKHDHAILDFILKEYPPCQYSTDINSKDILGVTVFHKTVYYCRSLEMDRVAFVNILYSHGSDLSTQNIFQETYLHNTMHYSVILNNINVVNLLIEKEIDVNARDNEGKTCLHKYYKNVHHFDNKQATLKKLQNDIEVSLLNAGTNPNAKNYQGLCPFNASFSKYFQKDTYVSKSFLYYMLNSLLLNLKAGLDPRNVGYFNKVIECIHDCRDENFDAKMLDFFHIVKHYGVYFESSFVNKDTQLLLQQQDATCSRCYSNNLSDDFPHSEDCLFNQQPSSLKGLSACCIRQHLQPNAIVGIQRLEMPTLMKGYILCDSYDHQIF